LKAHEPRSLDLVRLCCRALDSKKAGDLRVLDVRGYSSITDYLVIATATSEPHVRALRIELEKALDLAKARIIGFETARESGWAVMDAFDVMVHIFSPERRARYSLETLWRDGGEVPVEALLLDGKRPAKKPVRTARKPARKKPARRK
jgi:ribosome-associated protein